MKRLRSLLLLPVVVLFSLISSASGHGVPVLLTTVGGDTLAIQGRVPTPEFTNDGFEVYADEPGYGVNFASSGPPGGTVIELRTDGGLLYWDGSSVVSTDAVLTIEAPEFDSQGTPNNTPVFEYRVAADSPARSGMIWSTYPGANFWDAHGYYTLSPGAPQGVYGVPIVLASPTLEATDAYLQTFSYSEGAGWDPLDGVEALRSAFLVPLPGDYNGDSLIDSQDHDAWVGQYGLSVAPGQGADGSPDGVVDAADYTVWRDAASASPGGALPEPASLALIASVLLPIVFARNRTTSTP